MAFETRDTVALEEYMETIRPGDVRVARGRARHGRRIGRPIEATREALYELGLHVGLAFQLQDDYLDAFGNPENFGKQVGGDILADKKTFLASSVRSRRRRSRPTLSRPNSVRSATARWGVLDLYRHLGVDVEPPRRHGWPGGARGRGPRPDEVRLCPDSLAGLEAALALLHGVAEMVTARPDRPVRHFACNLCVSAFQALHGRTFVCRRAIQLDFIPIEQRRAGRHRGPVQAIPRRPQFGGPDVAVLLPRVRLRPAHHVEARVRRTSGSASGGAAKGPKEFRVINLIYAYRTRSHLFTKTNPVRARRDYSPDLSIAHFWAEEVDLDTVFEAGSEVGIGASAFRDIIAYTSREITFATRLASSTCTSASRSAGSGSRTTLSWPTACAERGGRATKKFANPGDPVFEEFLQKKFVARSASAWRAGRACCPRWTPSWSAVPSWGPKSSSSAWPTAAA